MDNALELRAWADNDSDPERAMLMRHAANEIDRLRKRIEQSKHFWIEAAEIALQKGDFRPLKLRVDAARTPFQATETT